MLEALCRQSSTTLDIVHAEDGPPITQRTSGLGFASYPGATITVKIDGVEPNIFPEVDDLDARDAGRDVELFLDVRIDGNHTPVTVPRGVQRNDDRLQAVANSTAQSAPQWGASCPSLRKRAKLASSARMVVSAHERPVRLLSAPFARPRGASFRPTMTSAWGEALREQYPPTSARASLQSQSAC
jgi:hypothetical protein